jgi:hypothetical protein
MPCSMQFLMLSVLGSSDRAGSVIFTTAPRSAATADHTIRPRSSRGGSGLSPVALTAAAIPPCTQAASAEPTENRTGRSVRRVLPRDRRRSEQRPGDLLRLRRGADMSALTTVTGLRCRRGGRSRSARGTCDSRKLASSHGASTQRLPQATASRLARHAKSASRAD